MKQDGTRYDNDRKAFDSRERLRTYWPELRGRVQERWSRLDDERLAEVDGEYDRLAEKLRDAYGVSDDEANRQVDDFVETHWGAMSAGNLTPASASIDNTGMRDDTVTNTPASTSAKTRGDHKKTREHPPGETRVRKHDERKSSVGPGTIEPGGRDI
ncbi:MAG TPA: hypothetical protein VF275_10170 [Gammaproteobacteria bacterium]